LASRTARAMPLSSSVASSSTRAAGRTTGWRVLASTPSSSSRIKSCCAASPGTCTTTPPTARGRCTWLFHVPLQGRAASPRGVARSRPTARGCGSRCQRRPRRAPACGEPMDVPGRQSRARTTASCCGWWCCRRAAATAWAGRCWTRSWPCDSRRPRTAVPSSRRAPRRRPRRAGTSGRYSSRSTTGLRRTSTSTVSGSTPAGG